jgi:hypothetical protein
MRKWFRQTGESGINSSFYPEHEMAKTSLSIRIPKNGFSDIA